MCLVRSSPRGLYLWEGGDTGGPGMMGSILDRIRILQYARTGYRDGLPLDEALYYGVDCRLLEIGDLDRPTFRKRWDIAPPFRVLQRDAWRGEHGGQ